jgi:hypothetical protein
MIIINYILFGLICLSHILSWWFTIRVLAKKRQDYKIVKHRILSFSSWVRLIKEKHPFTAMLFTWRPYGLWNYVFIFLVCVLYSLPLLLLWSDWLLAIILITAFYIHGVCRWGRMAINDYKIFRRVLK